MGNVTTTARPEAGLQGAVSPLIHNVSAPLAATEYSQALQSKTKKVLIRCRGNATMNVAFSNGQTSVEWLTVPPGCNYTEELIEFTGSIYFQTNKINQIIEIVEWL